MSSTVIFKDRVEAGKKLAGILNEFKNTDAVVLALPRGGVIIGKEISQAINLPLDIIVTRKIGAPGNDEYAIGAIDILGNSIFNVGEKESVNKKWLYEKIASEKKEALRRLETYRKGMYPLNLNRKTAIIVDDGIATGLTMQVAVAYAKKAGAEKIIVAVPVASAESLKALRNIAEVRVLETPVFFSAVGEWYENFPQVTDREVIRTLAP